MLFQITASLFQNHAIKIELTLEDLHLEINNQTTQNGMVLEDIQHGLRETKILEFCGIFHFRIH